MSIPRPAAPICSRPTARARSSPISSVTASPPTASSSPPPAPAAAPRSSPSASPAIPPTGNRTMIRFTLLARSPCSPPARRRRKASRAPTMIDKAVAGFTGRAIGDDGGARTAGRYAAQARGVLDGDDELAHARARFGGGGVPRPRMAHLRAGPHGRAGGGRSRPRSRRPPRRSPSPRSSSSAAIRCR